MTAPSIPGGFFHRLELNLADRLEAVVGDEATFLGNIDANTPLIFIKFEKIEFDENFKYRRAWIADRFFFAPRGHGYRNGKKSLRRAGTPLSATEISP